MVPLGILTAVIGAIRVSGPRWMRAVIGRARETRAFAEFELMSSTSHEVCELFNGTYIVRAMGRPQLQQFILLDDPAQSEAHSDEACGIHTLRSALRDGLICHHSYPGPLMNPSVNSDPESQNRQPFPNNMNQAAPNMQLNISVNSTSTVQRNYTLLFCAFLGTALQLTVLIVSGLTVYHHALSARIGAPFKAYGFPLFVAGTVLLVLGMVICSYTIEQSTIERSWQPENQSKLGIIWLQRKQSVNDQSFDPFLIVGGVKDSVITSTRVDPQPGKTHGRSYNKDQDAAQREKRYSATFTSSILPFSGSIFGLTGFFLQFQGLRGLSWPSSVAQLIAIILMAVLRASIRYSLSHLPKHYSATDNFEMEWLSLHLVLCLKDSIPIPVAIEGAKSTAKDDGKERTRFSPDTRLFWRVITAEIYPGWKPCYALPGTLDVWKSDNSNGDSMNEYSDEEKILRVRKRLGALVLAPWEGPASKAAISLSKAIESVMDKFFPEPNKANDKNYCFTWSLEAETGEEAKIDVDENVQEKKFSDTQTPKEKIRFIVKYSENSKGWQTDSKVLDAALSLWMSHLQTKSQEHQRLGIDVQYWQIIGDSSNNILERDLSWWIKDTLIEEISKDGAVPKTNQPNGGMENPLFIGFQGLNKGSSSDSIKTLAIRRNGTLANSLAQHVFSAFMWGVAAKTPHESLGSGEILQPEKFSEANIQDSWTSPRLQTRELAQVAQGVEQTGLCRLDEAYMSIIPPLSHLHKLPNEVMVTLATERVARRHLDWDETSKIYLDILQYSMMDRPCRYSCSLIAAVIEILSSISGPLLDKSDLEKMCKEAVALKDALEETLEKLEQINQGAFLAELQFLYKKQDRELVLERLLKEVIQSSKPVEKIPAEHESAWWCLTDNHFKAMESECFTALKSSEKDIFGWTPLHYAVITGNIEQIKESKSLPILADMAGRTPVHYAAQRKSHLVLQALLGTEKTPKEEGRNAANEVEREGMLPLHLAAQSGKVVEIVSLLLPYTDEINLRDKWGRTALYLAAENGSLDIIKVLLGNDKNNPEAKIDIECNDRLQRRTALHAAAASKHHNILTMLAGKDGRGLNWKDSDQKTALELAVANDCELSIVALVEAFGIRDSSASEASGPEKEKKLQWSQLERPEQDWSIEDELAAAPKSQEKVEAIKGVLADEQASGFSSQQDNKVNEICHWKEALDLSIFGGHRKALVKMIELAEGTSRNETWARALSTAAKEGKEKIVAMLLDHKEPSKFESQKVTDKGKAASPYWNGPNISPKARTKNSPVGRKDLLFKNPINAEGSESSQGAQLQAKIASLVQRKDMAILINRKDDKNETPLFWAASNGHAKAVDVLLRENADNGLASENGWTPLDSAAAHGHVEVVKLLLEQGANIEAVSRNGYTPVNSAAVSGHVKVVKLLLEHGANIEAVSRNGYTPVNSAAVSGHVKVVKLLLEHGANIEVVSSNGCTPVNSAAVSGHVKVVKLLLEKGANIEAGTLHRGSPLHLAAKEGHLELVGMLLDKGANIEAPDVFGRTPLKSALNSGHVNVMKLLLEKGANKEAVNNAGLTLLNSAAYSGQVEIVELLLESGADIGAASKDGWTPLYSASISGHVEVVKLLLEKGANVEIADSDGFTPLNYASHFGYVEVVKLLLEKGADIGAASNDGWTPCNSALRSGHAKVVELLLEKGADIGVTDGWTPLNSASVSGHVEIVKLLLEKGANKEPASKFEWTPLNLASSCGHVQVVKLLLEKETNTEAANEDECTPLNSASSSGHVEVVKLLLEKGANEEAADNDGRTPLNSASSSGHVGVVKLLLEKGANKEAADHGESTPLNSAACSGHVEVVKLLLEKGANPEAANDEGWTPLNSASNSGHVEVAKLLLEKGANKEAADNDGWTPLNSASSSGHVGVVKLLLEKGANIEAANKNGRTPLITAARICHVEVVKLLLAKGANIEAETKKGRTPLFFAAQSGNLELVKVLLEKGANKKAANEDGTRPLDSAILHGHLEVVTLLTEEGA
ncbi:hypothetical protein MMC31_000383 [Peltigera leucophlebia]|nr:hypothetical protein [Peltigera leucophlebia]